MSRIRAGEPNPGIAEIRRFELVEDMVSGKASAKMLFFDEAGGEVYTKSDRITRDLYSIIPDFMPKNGTIVFAKRWADSGRWEIIGEFTSSTILKECGDLLAGWRPGLVFDLDQTNCAGTANVTLLSSDVPSGPTNTVNRGAGYVGLDSWLFLGGAVNSSTLWVDDSPDFIDLTKDFTIRIPFNPTVIPVGTNTRHALLDIRGGVLAHLREAGGLTVLLRIELFDGTSTTIFDYTGIPAGFLVNVWYVAYLRWNQSTKVMTVNVMQSEIDLAVRVNQDVPALANDISPVSGNTGIFVAGDSASSPAIVGLTGRHDQLLFWQRFLLDCEVSGDYNCGLLSTLPAPNVFFTGPGGPHRKPARISSMTEPTLSVGEWVLWDDKLGKSLLLYNDPILGQGGVELTV